MATTDRLLYIGTDNLVRQLGFDPAATDWAGGGSASSGVTSFNVPVALACTANDLMLVQENSSVRPALATAGGLPNEINTTAGPSASKANAAVEVYTAYYTLPGEQAGTSLCELGDGNIAYGYTGNGTTATTGVRLKIATPSGTGIYVASIDSALTGCYGVRIVKVTSTTFVLAYCCSNTGQIKFGLFNNDGSVAVAITAVSNTVAGSYVWEWAISELLGGNGFVILYRSGTNLVFSRYNTNAVLQGAETTVQASATPSYMGLLSLTNGGFWAVYQYTTTDFRFGRYNSAGAMQGSLTTITSGNVPLQFGVDPRDSMVELSNGNVVICGPSPTTRDADIYVYNASGGSITSIDLGTSDFRISQRLGVCRTASGGFAVAGVAAGGTGVNMATYSASGSAGIAATTVDSTGQAVGAAANGVGAILRSLGGAGFAVCHCDVNSTGGRSVRLVTVSQTLGAVGTTQAFTSFAGGVYGLCAILTTGGRMASLYAYASNPNAVNFGVYNVVRRSVIGVATTTVAAGASATVSFSGAYTLNQDMSPGVAFDHRAQYVPGVKGFVIGNAAVLLGVT